MDKVYITKEQLKDSIYKKRKQAGPILNIFAYSWLMVVGLWTIPIVIVSILWIIAYLPFIFLDNLITRRKND